MTIILISCSPNVEKYVESIKKGDTLFNKKKYNSAIIFYQTAFKNNPDSFEVVGKMLGCYAGLNNFNAGISFLDSIRHYYIKHNKKDLYIAYSVFYSYKANVTRNKSDFQKIINYCDSLLFIIPTFSAAYEDKSEALYNIASIKNETLNKDSLIREGLITVNYGMKFSHNNSKLLFNKALLLYLGEDLTGALDNLNTIISSKQKDSDLLFNCHRYKGIIFFEKYDFDAAKLQFDTAINYQPNLGILYLNRGTTELKQIKYDDACKDLRKAFDLGENEALKYISLFCQ